MTGCRGRSNQQQGGTGQARLPWVLGVNLWAPPHCSCPLGDNSFMMGTQLQAGLGGRGESVG